MEMYHIFIAVHLTGTMTSSEVVQKGVHMDPLTVSLS